VLSVGSNKITQLEDSVIYLKSLKNNLQVLRIDDNKFKSEKNHRFYCIACLDGLKYVDYTLIENAELEKSKEENKDDIQADTGGDENKADGGIDQELIDARIDNTFQILDQVMRASEDYPIVSQLPGYPDLFNNSDNAIDEKWQLFKSAMINGCKSKNLLIKNCESLMRAAEI